MLLVNGRQRRFVRMMDLGRISIMISLAIMALPSAVLKIQDFSSFSGAFPRHSFSNLAKALPCSNTNRVEVLDADKEAICRGPSTPSIRI